MGTDTNSIMGDVTAGRNFSLSIGVDNKDEATRIFNSLVTGGKITMPIADTFWGVYFGMLIDRFGFMWMVNYDYPKK